MKTKDSENKRAQGFNKIVERHKHQKNLIKSALSNVDASSSKRIIFDTNNPLTNGKHEGKRLFESDDDESDFEINFEEKKQFEGEQGQKLLNLKSRYNNDDRFTLDERFIENDDEDNKKKNSYENKKITKNEQKMIRFDPALAEHSKFVVTESTAIKEKSKRKKKDKKSLEGSNANSENPLPDVSKESFYKVDENIKDALQSKESFSLLNMFGKSDEKCIEEGNDNRQEEINKKKTYLGPNPFRYDSSSDEEEIGKVEEKIEATIEKEETKVIESTTTVTNKLWTESFFFEENDYRLQEGLDFIKRISETDKDTNFSKVRRDLKQIVKAKVRNNKSKNKMYKKKLGGNKRKKLLRMKKALKR